MFLVLAESSLFLLSIKIVGAVDDRVTENLNGSVRKLADLGTIIGTKGSRD